MGENAERRAKIRQAILMSMSNGHAAHEALVSLSMWDNMYNSNKHRNVSSVLSTIVSQASILKDTNRRIDTLVNNAAIALDPLHKPPADKYKGFLRRYGVFLSHARKKTILTKAPYIRKKSDPRRLPPKLTRVTRPEKLKPHEILAQYFFPKGPRPVEYLGGGGYGKVYTTSDGRVMKFVAGKAPQEYTALRNLQHTGMVPSFRNGNGKVLQLPRFQKQAANSMFGFGSFNSSSHMTAFIMGRVGGSNPMTLRKYARTYLTKLRAGEPANAIEKERLKNIVRRLRSTVNTLGLKGISHGNMHDDNIIVEVDSNGRIRRMWLIDFGHSSKIPIGRTAKNMLAASHAILRGRGLEPGSFKTRGLDEAESNVQYLDTEKKSRTNENMIWALTGKHYAYASKKKKAAPAPARPRNRALNIRNNRKLIAGMKSPRVTTPARRAKSASPSRSTSNTPRGSPVNKRASPRRSPPRPRSRA